MAGRIKNLSKGNFKPSKLGTPSVLPAAMKANMDKGFPQRQALSMTMGKTKSKGHWSQPGK